MDSIGEPVAEPLGGQTNRLLLRERQHLLRERHHFRVLLPFLFLL
tara:strand:- start:368 stop:502 length:135 start_codon:yes stop_codon:yes gene_type:complete